MEIFKLLLSPINLSPNFFIIVTEVVVSLDAPDEFLKNRVMNLPESVVAGTHNTEEGLFQIIHDHSKKHKA